MNIMNLSQVSKTADPKFQSLVNEYGGSVPRYTSYPTAPEWKHDYSQNIFEDAIKVSNEKGNDYSLYLHIPFCESQCYYCACNVVISKKPEISKDYVERLKEEIEYIGSKIDKKRKVVQMAWGGGTPTYLSPNQIRDIFDHIKEFFSLYKPEEQSESGHEYSIEIDPRVTSKEHLETLHELGFNRLSMGIQDFNPETQENINRIQSFEMVENIVSVARTAGFPSINFDLIYGLPFQTLSTFEETIELVKIIDPERIALFNYAHIPQFFPFQKKYIEESALPDQLTKCEIFDLAVQKFTEHGYEFIGIDHFAKPEDELSKAQHANKLYRNFQGYTTHDGCDLFGLGLTAISSIQGVYKQNMKKLSAYYDRLNPFSAEKFYKSTNDDIERREIIKEIMCHCKSTIDKNNYREELDSLRSFENNDLIRISESENEFSLEVTELGRFFIRNIAACFDYHLRQRSAHKVFSKSL